MFFFPKFKFFIYLIIFSACVNVNNKRTFTSSNEKFYKIENIDEDDIISEIAQIYDTNEQAVTSSHQPQKQDYSKLKTGREDIAQATQLNKEAAQRDQSGPVKSKHIMVTKKPGRNERVKVLNLQNGETKEMKFKQAEPLINSGSWQMVEMD